MFGESMTLNGYDVLFLFILFVGTGIAINVGIKEILKVIGRTHDDLDATLQTVQEELRIVKARLERMSDD